MLPLFDDYGNLPAGIHMAPVEEVVNRFGHGSVEREVALTEHLSPQGYERTKVKLENLERRLAEIERRADLPAKHREQVLRSYRQMMQQYRREIKLYEAFVGAR